MIEPSWRAIAAGIRTETKVISVSHVLWTTGRKMPVAEIAALSRDKGLLCVVDGAQAVGGMPVDVKALGCHAYATTGHKWLLGPKGIGLLYISADAADAIKPVQWMSGKKFVSGSTRRRAIGAGDGPGRCDRGGDCAGAGRHRAS